MKLLKTTKTLIHTAEATFTAKDKYGRFIGASVSIESAVYEEVSEDATGWSRSTGDGVFTGPGVYFTGYLQPTRNGEDYQAYTSKTFATEAEARAYVDGYMAKKAKEAAKLAAKAAV